MGQVLLSLRGRLLFLICLATLPAILFTFFVAENERGAALARMEREALHLAGLASREHSQQIRGARELLSWLGAKLAQEGLASPIATDPSFLRALLAGHPQLANIGVLSPDGRVLASAHPLASYRPWNDNPAYLAALRSEDVVAGTYLISPIFERPTLNHAYAIRDAGHDVIAVLFNGLDLGWLSKIARPGELPEGFSLFIADREGRVVANGDPEDPTPTRLGRMFKAGDAGVRRYFLTAPLEGLPGLNVAVGLPYDRVVRQANSAFYRTLAGLGILTLFIIVAVFIAAELGILRALRALARVAQRFGAGDLAARASAPRAHTEFASLVRAFNNMADTLAVRHVEAVDAQARLRALASRLQGTREAEAARISRELHDEIGQVLTSLNIGLAELQSCCPPDERAGPCATVLQERAATMRQQIEAAVGFVRRISSDLRPGVLDKLGLTAALEWQAREIEAHTGLAVQVEAEVREGALDETVSVTLFRIVQEALTNVIRHAQARLVEVSLLAIPEGIQLLVRDDGRGISRDEAEGGESLGIIGMRERVLLIHGDLLIEGLPGRGTTVRVTVPPQPAPRATDAHPAG